MVDRATFRGIIIAATRKNCVMYESFLAKVRVFGASAGPHARSACGRDFPAQLDDCAA
jgi:hypothetical protein